MYPDKWNVNFEDEANCLFLALDKQIHLMTAIIFSRYYDVEFKCYIKFVKQLHESYHNYMKSHET